MPDVLVLVADVILRGYLPYIYILLGNVLAAIGTAIPSFEQVGGFEDQVAPTVEDPELEMSGINADALHVPYIVHTASVRSKGVGSPKLIVAADADQPF